MLAFCALGGVLLKIILSIFVVFIGTCDFAFGGLYDPDDHDWLGGTATIGLADAQADAGVKVLDSESYDILESYVADKDPELFKKIGKKNEARDIKMQKYKNRVAKEIFNSYLGSFLAVIDYRSGNKPYEVAPTGEFKFWEWSVPEETKGCNKIRDEFYSKGMTDGTFNHKPLTMCFFPSGYEVGYVAVYEHEDEENDMFEGELRFWLDNKKLNNTLVYSIFVFNKEKPGAVHGFFEVSKSVAVYDEVQAQRNDELRTGKAQADGRWRIKSVQYDRQALYDKKAS